jgi:tetratricopeptide (TPR) repeat protein
MKPLKYEEVRAILPSLDELRPVFDLLLATSTPDPAHRWSGSGELHTEGARLVEGAVVLEGSRDLVEDVRRHAAALYAAIAEALRALAEGDRAVAASALLDAAALEERAGRPDRTRAYAEAAYKAGRDGGDRRPVSRALRRWGRAAKAMGSLREARARYEEGFEIAVAVYDTQGAAEAAIGVGNVLEQQGRWDDAAAWYRRALDLLGNGDEPAPERWQAMVNLHIVLRSSDRLEESVPWLVAAQAEAERQGDGSAAPFVENAHGQLHLWAHEFERAEARFRRALDATTHPAARVTIRLNLAEALLAQRRLLDAGEETREAEREALVGGVLPKLPEVYRLLGRIASASGNPDAFVLFERALELGVERGLPALEEALTLQVYAEAERSRGEEEAADQLLARARDLYATLGIRHVRHPWTDVYGAKSEVSPSRLDWSRVDDHTEVRDEGE